MSGGCDHWYVRLVVHPTRNVKDYGLERVLLTYTSHNTRTSYTQYILMSAEPLALTSFKDDRRNDERWAQNDQVVGAP